MTEPKQEEATTVANWDGGWSAAVLRRNTAVLHSYVWEGSQSFDTEAEALAEAERVLAARRASGQSDASPAEDPERDGWQRFYPQCPACGVLITTPAAGPAPAEATERAVGRCPLCLRSVAVVGGVLMGHPCSDHKWRSDVQAPPTEAEGAGVGPVRRTAGEVEPSVPGPVSAIEAMPERGVNDVD